MASPHPISFQVIVNGKRLNATLVKINDHIIHSSFFIRFSDGHEDSFHDYVDKRVRGLKERESQAYSTALKTDLPLFNLLKAGVTVRHFAWTENARLVNGWLFTQPGKDGDYYTAYVNGQYKFDISEMEGKWVVKADQTRDPLPIDRALAEMAASLIDKLPAKPAKKLPSKEIEFRLEVLYQGKSIDAFGIMVPANPFPQINIAIKTGTPEAPHLDMYQFFKIDAKEQIVTWNPCPADKEPMAKAIAAALDKKFSGTQFCNN